MAFVNGRFSKGPMDSQLKWAAQINSNLPKRTGMYSSPGTMFDEPLFILGCSAYIAR